MFATRPSIMSHENNPTRKDRMTTDPYYWCAVCHQPIVGSDVEPRHTFDGEDCHANCCPFCHAEETQ